MRAVDPSKISLKTEKVTRLIKDIWATAGANACFAAERAANIAPVIAELRAAGAASLRAIADGLNQRGIPTARGIAVWSATQVMRVMAQTGQGPTTRVYRTRQFHG
jgi:hypothetical protein